MFKDDEKVKIKTEFAPLYDGDLGKKDLIILERFPDGDNENLDMYNLRDKQNHIIPYTFFAYELESIAGQEIRKEIIKAGTKRKAKL